MRKKPADQQVAFLRALVETCVLAIAEREDEVRIDHDVTPARVVFSVRVAASDVGLVLGNDGATANAIRRVLWTACKKTDLKADLDIMTRGRR